MRKKVFRAIVFCASLFLSAGFAFGFTPVFPADIEEQTPVANGRITFNGPSAGSWVHIESMETGILLDIENSFLADALQQVANATSIQFNVGSQLTSHRITARIEGPNWNSVVGTLLKDYSKVTVWNEKSKSIKEILLLGKNNWDPQQEYEFASFNYPPEGQENQSTGLSIAKLKLLVGVPPGNPIPPYLFADQEIRSYIELKGIRSPEGWKNRGKVRVVLQKVKKDLNRLLFEKQRKLKTH